MGGGGRRREREGGVEEGERIGGTDLIRSLLFSGILSNNLLIVILLI